MITTITFFAILIVLLSSLYVKIQSLKSIDTNSPKDYRRYLLYGYILDNLIIVFAVFLGLYTTYSHNILYIITAITGAIMIVISIVSDKEHFKQKTHLKQKTHQTNRSLFYYDMAKLISITFFIILITVLTLLKVA